MVGQRGGFLRTCKFSVALEYLLSILPLSIILVPTTTPSVLGSLGWIELSWLWEISLVSKLYGTVGDTSCNCFCFLDAGNLTFIAVVPKQVLPICMTGLSSSTQNHAQLLCNNRCLSNISTTQLLPTSMYSDFIVSRKPKEKCLALFCSSGLPGRAVTGKEDSTFSFFPPNCAFLAPETELHYHGKLFDAKIPNSNRLFLLPFKTWTTLMHTPVRFGATMGHVHHVACTPAGFIEMFFSRDSVTSSHFHL